MQSDDPEVISKLDQILLTLHVIAYEQAKPKTAQEMIAETLREAGVLILVFVPIYCLIEQQSRTVRWGGFWVAIASGIAILLAGIQLERKRK